MSRWCCYVRIGFFTRFYSMAHFKTSHHAVVEPFTRKITPKLQYFETLDFRVGASCKNDGNWISIRKLREQNESLSHWIELKKMKVLRNLLTCRRHQHFTRILLLLMVNNLYVLRLRFVTLHRLIACQKLYLHRFQQALHWLVKSLSYG